MSEPDIFEEIIGGCSGTRGLEEKIAETKDPETKKKLEEILHKRKKNAHGLYIFVCVIVAIFFIGSMARSCAKIQHNDNMKALIDEEMKRLR